MSVIIPIVAVFFTLPEAALSLGAPHAASDTASARNMIVIINRLNEDDSLGFVFTFFKVLLSHLS
ncbi:hypothetical protein [Paenibacillus tianmuensis]|uniref:hypothetical protein n=1 Tax=Paenibacillus tianmuensis TaxID=624147 RepID=UPI001C27E710|nr:hypothetical protein [Paenibacillus tianmuensis]